MALCFSADWLVFRYAVAVSKRRRSQANSGAHPLTVTYQTRVCVYGSVDREFGGAALAAYAELYGMVERKLFAAVSAGHSAANLKSAYMVEHGIPGRMFNGVRVSLEGKIASVREQQKLRVDDLKRRVVRTEGQIAECVKVVKESRPIRSVVGWAL